MRICSRIQELLPYLQVISVLLVALDILLLVNEM